MKKLDHTLQDLIAQRKLEHLDLCASEDVESSDRFTGFSDFALIPDALPELNSADLDTAVSFLSRTFAMPYLITGMTGGVEKGEFINKNLAQGACRWKIPMGVGSQRIALENPKLSGIFQLKKDFSDLFLIGNLGCTELVSSRGLDYAKRAVEEIGADALAIHVNVLQELVQDEGGRDFRGLLVALETLCQALPVPVIVKEVGSGFSAHTARKLMGLGIRAIDVGGRGGTSWGYIEGLRSSDEVTQALGRTFRDWGVPTAQSLVAVRGVFEELPIIATGGIRDGWTAAKAVALGANLVGVGLPLMKAAMVSPEKVDDVLSFFERSLRIAMMASGAQSLSKLKVTRSHRAAAEQV